MKKEYRIKKTLEFEQIIKNKIFVVSPGIVLYLKKRREEKARVGITVKNKVGNAVVRNKVKRQVRMIITETYDFDEKFDSIFLIKEKYLENDYNTNKKVIETLYNKAKQVKIDRYEKNVKEKLWTDLKIL